MDINREERKESYEELSSLAFRLISFEKRSSNHVRNILLQKGMDQANVNSIVDKIEFHIYAEKEKSQKDMNVGFYLVAGGVVTNQITFMMTDYLVFYFVTWGSIAFGAYIFLRGLLHRK